MSHKTLFYLPLLLLFFSTGCERSDGQADQKTIIMAHHMHLNHPVSIAMDRMAELVHKNSGGKLSISMYPAGQLGGERELLELTQVGTIGITKVSGAVLENIVPPRSGTESALPVSGR